MLMGVPMIILIIGGVGSGKSVYAVKEMKDRGYKTFCNFDCKLKNAVRLKEEHIIHKVKKGEKRNGDIIYQDEVNYDFWEKMQQKGEPFDIIIDEVHNVLHSRRSMSSWNTNFSKWLAQIRKVLGSSEKNHLYLISQRLNAIDISARELCHQIIALRKVMSNPITKTVVREMGRKKTKMLPSVYILKFYFSGEDAINAYEAFKNGIKSYSVRSAFVANPYFQYYDSYSMVRFGAGVYV